MKHIIVALSFVSLLYATTEDESSENSEEKIKKESEEIALLDQKFVQKPVAPENLTPPKPKITPSKKSTLWTVTLSTLAPGLGHIYLGDFKTAGGLMGSAGLGYTLALSPSINDSVREHSFIAVQNVSYYSIYSAYRDVRSYNNNTNYHYQMPTETLSELTLAPFRLSIISKPEVWGGLLGGLAIGATITSLAFPAKTHIHLSPRLDRPIFAFPIGIGEESFFRGFVQSQLSEYFTPWGGILLSALTFAVAHIPNAQFLEPEDQWRYYSFSLPYIAALGTYFGWLTYKNVSLKESVALHSWYDFSLFMMNALVTRAAIGRSLFAISVPF